MDVKYRPEPWQNMGDGMNRITKDALMKLREANESLKRIDGRIRDLDSDGSIHFNPKDQSQKIGELLDSYTTLQKYCGEAGRLVSEHIDKPFLVEMDKFAQKVRDTSILSFETNNRIGSTTTTVLPGAHAGYGSVPQTIQKKKDKITVEDIFKDSPAFDNVLREEYKELKKRNPDAKLNYEEYKKVVPSTRGFEYKSIEDEQKKLEMVRDIGIGVGIIITTILCPPLGAAAAVVYGGVQIKSGIDGEDWGTHRKLSQEERVGNIIFGGLDAIPVVGAVGKGVKAFKGMSELADLAKLLKFKEGMPGFNPNLGKNVVQSLKENKTLKNALDAMKNTPIPVAVRTVDTGIGMKFPYIESSTVGEVAGKFSKASTAAKDDAYQLAKGSGGVKGTGEATRLIPGTPGKVTGGSSTKLGQNLLESMGLPRSASRKGYQAQHIIPKNLRNHPVLKKIGMDMDHADNGIFLPIPAKDPSALSRHRGFHSVYNNVVKDQLDKLNINQSIKELEQQVFELQQKLKKGTESGLPLYKSKVLEIGIEKFYKTKLNEEIKIWQRGGGATEELWERWINK
ncbi:AHH domain-containing protein [Bacillus cereus group sp. BfR-BA-01382]|uniref:AHH domain-containing protein n=1 Tax=Bacillus cereus group sp. BfR-BA-01382 TaxID=2920326 RepID=UPI001F595A98